MIPLQHKSNFTDTVYSSLRSAMRLGGGALILLVLCAGVSPGQWRSTSEEVFSPVPWQASPRSSQQSTQRKSATSTHAAVAAVKDVSRKPVVNKTRPVAYDAKVVRTSGDESYVLDPVAEEQIAAPEGKPMVINEGGMPDGGMYDGYCDAYCDPAMNHPWKGGEYWFNPRYGLPPFMCRYPLWMGFARSRLWFRGEYLLWWMKGNDVSMFEEAVYMPPDGPGEMNNDSRSGGRAALGWWFTPEQCFGMEVNYLGIGESEFSFHDEYEEGSHDLYSTAEFQSFEFLLRRALVQRCHYRVDFLFGYRYGRLDDSLMIDDRYDNQYEYKSECKTLNRFNGGELGMSLNHRRGRWSYELLMKLGLGRTSSRVGILVDVNNYEISRVVKVEEFAVMPEVGLNLMYNITPRTAFTVGYNLVYLSHVARPGDQAYVINDEPVLTTDFWAHGLNVGFDFRF